MSSGLDCVIVGYNDGACYLASFMRRHGLSAGVVNFFNDDNNYFEQLLAKSPRAVAITTNHYFDPFADPRDDFVRSRSPETKVVVGGPHVFNVCSEPSPQPDLYVYVRSEEVPAEAARG